jgi:4-hydroxy-tetrahydrodipicolinate synthase
LNLNGSICALATPFRGGNDALDLDATGRLIEYQLAAGTQALVIAGSTGEGAALESDEFVALLEFAVRSVDGRVPVIAGTGLQSTRKTVAQTRLAAVAGAQGALVVTPPYVRPTQEGLYRHFVEVAEHGDLPVLLYNVPSRTACDLLPETTERLSAHARIVGIKEARADPERMEALLRFRTPAFRVWSGDDPTCARAMLRGADGVISVAANVVPARMQALCLSATGGDEAASARADRELRDLHELLGAEPNPIPLKWCLQRMGLADNCLRLPLLPLGAAYHAQGERVLEALGLGVTSCSPSRTGPLNLETNK